MKRLFLFAVLSAGLLCLDPSPELALAGKSGGSYGGGRSSGGGHSSSSRGGSSFSSPSGRSYSSGSHATGFSSRPSPSGKSYSSGKTSPAPTRTSPPTPFPGRTASSPSGKSYSSRPAPPSSPPPSTGYTSPSGKSYVPHAPSTAAPAGPRPRGSSFDAAAAEAQRKAESRAAYRKGTAPRPNYTDPKGETHPVDPRDRRIEDLRRELDHERWVNRTQRERQFYGGYVNRPVVVYQDPYNSYFWWWLLDQSLQTRALWAYNHQFVMDQARYQALLARDAQLEARVRQLEAQGTPRDPAYVPPGLRDPDLMYSDGYVDSAYNPQPAPPASLPMPPVSIPAGPYATPQASFWHGVRVLFWALVVIGILAFLIWLVFFKRWGATEA